MILDEICAHKAQEVAARKAKVSLAALQEAIAQARPPKDFRKALREEGISLIAEIKRRSPSRGKLLDLKDPVDLAGLYEATGARAISILTDQKYFGGSLDDLASVSRAARIPCLRKEFVIDAYQIFEARAHGADAILLIVRILSDAQLRDYLELADSLGMEALVETHTAPEIDRAMAAEARIVGINNRDLDTLVVDVNTTIELKKRVPGGKVLVSESGIHTRDHVRMLEDGGVDAILVGESLVTSSDIRAKILELFGRNES